MNVVSSKESENKMGAKNLGVVFGSILLGGAVLCFSLGLKTTLQRQNTIVQLMIENVETLFPEHRFEEFFHEYSYNTPYQDEDNQEDYNN
jgi:predicted nucleotidyltransferase